MRQGRALTFGLLTALLAGCANDLPVRSTSWFDRWRPFHGAAAVDVVELQVSLVERPPGDAFINQELWTLADEQIIPLERKAALEANGFRVGQLGGNTPAGLLTLLTSERSNVNPRRFFLHAGQSTLVVLGPSTPRCSFQFHQDGEPANVSLEKAQCAFQLVASLVGENGIRLQFTPQVRYGEKTLVPRAAPDGSGLLLQEEWPTKTYASLGWEVTLAANQYVVVALAPTIRRASVANALSAGRNRCLSSGFWPSVRVDWPRRRPLRCSPNRATKRRRRVKLPRSRYRLPGQRHAVAHREVVSGTNCLLLTTHHSPLTTHHSSSFPSRLV